MSLEVGSVIQGKYRITGLLGQGGMGAVYQGENTLIARRVAIKVLHGELRTQPEVIERFEREAQAAGRIGNDHILEVIDLGQLASGERFMVMEFLDGESLEQRLEREGALTAAQAYHLVRQLLLALEAAHDKGIVHRDLKPDNVFILHEKTGHKDFVKLIDFGISKFTAAADLKMTATGAVMGTPYFMSPEQAKGSKNVDKRTDLYAVGVILYRAVTGALPFTGDNFNEVLFSVVLSESIPPRQLAPSLDEGFESIILRSMARAPEARFQDAREFISALDDWAGDGRGVSLLPFERTSVADGPPSAVAGGPLGTVAAGPPGILDSSGRISGGITGGQWTQDGAVPFRSRSRSAWLIAGVALIALVAAAGFLLQETELDAANNGEPAPATSNITEEHSALQVAPEARPADEANSAGGKAGTGDSTPSGPAVTASETAPESEPESEPEPASKKAAQVRQKKPAASKPRTPVRTPAPPAAEERETKPKRPEKGELDFGY